MRVCSVQHHPVDTLLLTQHSCWSGKPGIIVVAGEGERGWRISFRCRIWKSRLALAGRSPLTGLCIVHMQGEEGRRQSWDNRPVRAGFNWKQQVMKVFMNERQGIHWNVPPLRNGSGTNTKFNTHTSNCFLSSHISHRLLKEQKALSASSVRCIW